MQQCKINNAKMINATTRGMQHHQSKIRNACGCLWNSCVQNKLRNPQKAALEGFQGEANFAACKKNERSYSSGTASVKIHPGAFRTRLNGAPGLTLRSHVFALAGKLNWKRSASSLHSPLRKEVQSLQSKAVNPESQVWASF